MESKKGIKQIGASSFLYSNSNDVIYNISIYQSENSIYFRFIKMKLKSVLLYEGKTAKEEFKGMVNKGVNSNSNSDSNSNSEYSNLLKEMSIIIYNQNFTIKEEKDCIKFTIAFEEINKTQVYKVIELKQITNNDPNKENEYLNIITKLTEIIDKQNETINRLEKDEAKLLDKVSNLEKVTQISLDAICQIKSNNIQPGLKQSQQNQIPQYEQPPIQPSRPIMFKAKSNTINMPNSDPYKNITHNYIKGSLITLKYQNSLQSIRTTILLYTIKKVI